MAHPQQGHAGQRALVKNAADPKQVKFAEQVERRRTERFAQALAAVMKTPEGRTVMAQLIRRAGVYMSIWDPSARIHYNAGRQDYGHELMADLVGIDEETYQIMEREEWNWNKQQERAIDAAHTSRAATSEGGSDER
jgi:hypothetical protein